MRMNSGGRIEIARILQAKFRGLNAVFLTGASQHDLGNACPLGVQDDIVKIVTKFLIGQIGTDVDAWKFCLSVSSHILPLVNRIGIISFK